MRKADEIIEDLLKKAVHEASIDKQTIIKTVLSHGLFREAIALMTEQQRKIEELEERVAIQSPDVVKCKECSFARICKSPKGKEYAECIEGIGNRTDSLHPLDWYCARGVLKEEGEEVGKSGETAKGTEMSGMREDIHHS